MIEKINDEELEFMMGMHNPVCAIECLFSDIDNLTRFDERMSEVRLYQLPMLSYDNMLDVENMKGLDKKEKFKLKKGSSDCYNFAARKIGKTVSQRLDIPLSMIHDNYYTVAATAPGGIQLSDLLDPVKNVIDSHPIFSEWKVNTKRHPQYEFIAKNGWHLKGINMNLKSKDPGGNWFGKHVKKIWGDEMSKETSNVYEKRKEAISELGVISRLCIKEGTKILMSDFSSKNIENIEIGDKIVAWNEQKGCLEETDVTGFFDSGIRDVIKIDNKKSDLWLTPEHKIRVKTKKNIKDDSSGTAVYRWREAKDALSEIFYADSLSYIGNKHDYYRGILIGLLESDGHCEIKQGKKRELKQYRLFQSSEVDFFKFVIDYFNLKYTEDIRENKRKGTWNKINKPLHCWRLSTKNNNFIKKIYKDLETNNEVQMGYLAGFVIGDGWIGSSGSLELSQCKRNLNKIEKIKKISKKLNIKYSYYKGKIDSKKHLIRFPKYSLVLPCTTKKGRKYREKILNVKRPVFKASSIKVKDFQENQQVYDIKTELNSFIANGFIVHNSGMTNFTRHMPIGKEFYKPKNKNKVINYPQMVSPFWDEEEKQDRIEFYGSESAPNFKIFVLGEVIEDGVSEFDIERVERCLNSRMKIKRFELKKKDYKRFKSLIVVDRPSNIDRIFVNADIGDGAGGTDITVIGEKGNSYKLLYNICLYHFTEPQQYEVFKWLKQELGIDVLALECGEACGRGLYHRFELDMPEFSKNLVEYRGNKKITVGYEKNEKGDFVLKKGKPISREEFMSEWSIRRLKRLLYSERIDIPKDDHKFLNQINSVISIRTGTRTRYACPSETGDHYFDSFRVFAIAQWLKKDFNATVDQNNTSNWGIGVTA